MFETDKEQRCGDFFCDSRPLSINDCLITQDQETVLKKLKSFNYAELVEVHAERSAKQDGLCLDISLFSDVEEEEEDKLSQLSQQSAVEKFQQQQQQQLETYPAFNDEVDIDDNIDMLLCTQAPLQQQTQDDGDNDNDESLEVESIDEMAVDHADVDIDVGLFLADNAAIPIESAIPAAGKAGNSVTVAARTGETEKVGAGEKRKNRSDIEPQSTVPAEKHEEQKDQEQQLQPQQPQQQELEPQQQPKRQRCKSGHVFKFSKERLLEINRMFLDA